ncbi:MAG: hypothetical protein J6K32_07170 [Clostridia bacterium]|nr:hypothetical protein [Clostridia bacterium]
MIHLFPKQKNQMLLSCAILLGMVAAFILIFPGVHPIAILLLGVLGAAAILFSQYTRAVSKHNQMIGILYNQLDAETFLRLYAPLLDAKVKDPNVYLMVRLHMSNAYCALGRFDDARAILSSIKPAPGKKPEDELLTRFAVASNLCYCAEQENDVETAKKHLDELLAIRAKLESMQQGKPEKKRMAFSTELNEQCYAFLTTGKADIEALKAQVQRSNQQLHRVTTSLWVARIDLAANNRREAESILNQIVKLAPDLYPGKVAAQLLADLPAKA